MTTYTTRDEAIQREIVEPILAGDVNSIDEYNIDAIADAVLGDYSTGYACKVDVSTFWQLVEDNARPVRTHGVVASCHYRKEVRRYDLPAVLGRTSVAEAQERYGKEIGVDPADVAVEYLGVIG